MEEILSEKCNFEKFDEMLIARNIDKIKDTKYSPVYQRDSTLDLEYIYLRSNIYIERLAVEDIAILTTILDSGSLEYDEEAKLMVQRTFVSILTEPDNNSNHSYSNNGRKIAPAASIVFEIGTYSNTEIQKSVEDTKEKMEEELSEALGIPVTIFVGF